MGIFDKRKKNDELQAKKAEDSKQKKEKAVTGAKASIHASSEIVELMKTFESSRMEENEKSKKTAWR